MCNDTYELNNIYNETLRYMFAQLPMFHRIGTAAYKANLDNTHALDAYFGHPHRKFKTIHVAGTNGKGSVSHALASVLQCAGYKVGLYTSPHIIDFRERIKINGVDIPKQEVVDFVKNHRAVLEELSPSFFEMTVALAFDYFARQAVDVAIVEVGLGGRLDSTNIITPLLSVITNIGLDHTEFLGDTLPLIAAEKAGIIKPHIPVVIGEWDAETAPVFVAKAKAEEALLFFASEQYRVLATEIEQGRQVFLVEDLNDTVQPFTVSLDLLGNYQRKNIVTILAVLNTLQQYSDLAIPNEAIKKGLGKAAALTGLRGRWEVISANPMVICDTGHNAHGLAITMQQLKNTPYKKLYVLFGVMADKHLELVLDLLPRDAYYLFTQANLPRAMDAQVLATYCMSAGLQGEAVKQVSQALAKAKSMATADDVIFIGGSTFVVAEALGGEL